MRVEGQFNTPFRFCACGSLHNGWCWGALNIEYTLGTSCSEWLSLCINIIEMLVLSYLSTCCMVI